MVLVKIMMVLVMMSSFVSQVKSKEGLRSFLVCTERLYEKLAAAKAQHLERRDEEKGSVDLDYLNSLLYKLQQIKVRQSQKYSLLYFSLFILNLWLISLIFAF